MTFAGPFQLFYGSMIASAGPFLVKMKMYWMTMGPLDKEGEMYWLTDGEAAGKRNDGILICLYI